MESSELNNTGWSIERCPLVEGLSDCGPCPAIKLPALHGLRWDVHSATLQGLHRRAGHSGRGRPPEMACMLCAKTHPCSRPFSAVEHPGSRIAVVWPAPPLAKVQRGALTYPVFDHVEAGEDASGRTAAVEPAPALCHLHGDHVPAGLRLFPRAVPQRYQSQTTLSVRGDVENGQRQDRIGMRRAM